MAHSKQLRVLNLMKTSVGGQWAMRQMRELVKLGVEVHVALPPGGRQIPEYEAAGVIIHPLEIDFPVRRPWRFPAMVKSLRQLVAVVNPDILHSHYVGTTLTMRLALGRDGQIPRIFQVPGPLHLEHTFFRQAEILTAGYSDYWIGTCHWIYERYRKSGIAHDRLFVSDYGVDLDTYTLRPKGNLRKELGLHANTKIVGMVGIMYAPKRLLGQTRGLKGHEDLIEALAICLKTEPEIVGVFIGGGLYNAARYERQVRAYGRRLCGNRAIFLGTRYDVPELLPDFDIAVQPSHTEGVAGTTVEALLLTIPVVATNVGGQPDLIVHGKTGWLVPPRQPTHLAAAVMEALHDPVRAQTMALQGRERARQLFDVRKNAWHVLEIYHTVLSRTGQFVHA